MVTVRTFEPPESFKKKSGPLQISAQSVKLKAGEATVPGLGSGWFGVGRCTVTLWLLSGGGAGG